MRLSPIRPIHRECCSGKRFCIYYLVFFFTLSYTMILLRLCISITSTSRWSFFGLKTRESREGSYEGTSEGEVLPGSTFSPPALNTLRLSRFQAYIFIQGWRLLLLAGWNLQCCSSFFESAVWTVSDEPYLPTAIYVRRRWNPLPSLIRWAACCCYALSDMSTLTFNTGVIHQIHVLYFFRLSEVLWLVLLGIYLAASISVRSEPYFNRGREHCLTLFSVPSYPKINHTRKIGRMGVYKYCFRYAIVYLSHSIPFQCDLLQFVIVDLLSGDTWVSLVSPLLNRVV